ncbi:tyrosine-type recombinase/integrase [bacterium]|nr:tyrosine-type recombinase/integrase [bacterium]
MTSLEKELSNYLSIRRGLGYKLLGAERLLRGFVDFMEAAAETLVTSELAVQWALGNGSLRPATSLQRLGAVRQFTRYLAGLDPLMEIPPQNLIQAKVTRSRPHIYSQKEIDGLLSAAARMGPTGALRPHTYHTFLGLLASTGIRLSEGLALQRDDVDLNRCILEIRKSKFRKSRLVALHASTVAALQCYATVRDVRHRRQFASFFITDKGEPLRDPMVRYYFVRLSKQVGLRNATSRSSHGPRIHDLRHSFAVKTLIRWYESGVEVDRRLPYLSTYLGHAHVADTYWYLSACPELLRLAGAKMEQMIAGVM